MTVRIYSCGHTVGTPERINAPCLACSHNQVDPPPATAYDEARTPLPSGPYIVPGMVVESVSHPTTITMRRTHAERRAMWMEARRRALLDQISRSNVEGGAGVWLCNDRADNEVIYRINRELVDAAREDDNAAP